MAKTTKKKVVKRSTKRPARKPVRKAAARTPKKPARTVKKATRTPATAARKPPARRASVFDPLFAPVKGAEQQNIGHVRLDVGRAGAARVKRMIYPVGFRWSVDMMPEIGSSLCMHAHVGFLAHGEIHIEYADGCVVEHKAPQIVAIEPGHDGWVVGQEPVVLIEFDFERDTVERLGMPKEHKH